MLHICLTHRPGSILCPSVPIFRQARACLVALSPETRGSITEANQNFSRVARMVDENGAAVILKNNVPRYVLMEFSQVEDEQQAKDEDILEISKRLIAKNKQAYEVLAK